MKYFVITLIVWCVSASCYAQQLDLFSLQGSYVPVTHQDNGYNLMNYSLEVKFPAVRDSNDVFLTGVKYTRFGYDNIFENGVENLHGLDLVLLYSRRFNNDARIGVFFTPGLSGDFQDISFGSLQYSAGVTFRFKASEKLQIGTGVAYSQQFVRHVVVPLLDINWEISDKLSLNGPIPQQLMLTYQASKKVSTGFKLQVHNTSAQFNNDTQLQVINDSYVNFSLFGHYELKKNLFLTFDVGMIAGRELELYEADTDRYWQVFTSPFGKVPSPAESITLEQIPQLKMGLSYSITAK
ncbi:MAG: DUF6268 family outer membrane beta-barrel protein [Bacteroidota bacterium]